MFKDILKKFDKEGDSNQKRKIENIVAFVIILIITVLVIIPFLIKTICNCKRFYDNNKDRIETLNKIHKL